MFLILPAGKVDFLEFILNLPALITLSGSYSDHIIPVFPFVCAQRLVEILHVAGYKMKEGL
jgi:hypothetical protein